MRITTKRIIILSTLLSSVIIAGSIYFFASISSNEPTPDSGGVEYDGPTPQELVETEAHKDEVVKQMDIEKASEQTKSSQAKKNVIPVITNSAQNGNNVLITAYIPGIFEEGGTCKLEVSKDSNTITRSNSAFANATTTDCKPFKLARSDFLSNGNWKVKITYSSKSAQGTSQVSTIRIK